MKIKITLAILLLSNLVAAQSDGPRAHLPTPKGVWGLNLKYLNMDQNLLPNGNVYLQNADLKADVMPITLLHTFNIGKKWARVYGVITPVFSMKGEVATDIQLPRTSFDVSGFSDGFLGFEMNILGNEVADMKTFVKTPPKFNLNGLFKFWYSGTYDDDELVNIGSNRSTFEFGIPMQIPLLNNSGKILWLETWPGIQFFTPNNNPAQTTRANKITQAPLFYLENHLSYNFNPKLYAGLSLRFQQGGQTSNDGVKQGNQITMLAGGPMLGYKLLPFMDLWADYGNIFWGDNGEQSEMFRLSLTISYLKI